MVYGARHHLRLGCWRHGWFCVPCAILLTPGGYCGLWYARTQSLTRELARQHSVALDAAVALASKQATDASRVTEHSTVSA